MTFNFLNVVLVQQLAGRAGRVPDGRETQIALVSAMLPGPMGLLMGVLALRQAEEPEPSLGPPPRVTPTKGWPTTPPALAPALATPLEG